MPAKPAPTDASQHKLDNWLQSESFSIVNENPTQASTPNTAMSNTPNSNLPERKRGHFMVSPSSSLNTSCNCSTSAKLDEVTEKLDKLTETVAKLEVNIMQRIDCVQESVITLTTKVNQIETSTVTNKANIQSNTSDIISLKQSVEFAHTEIESLKASGKEPKSNNTYVLGLLKQQQKYMQQEIDKIVAYSQRHNVLLDGVYEEKGENCFNLVCGIINNYLQLPDAHTVIDKAHRLGPKSLNKPRPIIVRFKYHSARDMTLSRRHMLMNSGLGLREHLPPRLERDKVTLEKIVKVAQERDPNAKCIPGPRLLYNGNAYDLETLKNSGLNIEQVHQKETNKAVYFQGKLSVFSNFHQSPLVIEGTTYHCVEQFYQAKKAERNGNTEIHSMIMLESDPAEIKRLSKLIKTGPSINPQTEQEENLKVMYQGLEMKFIHNPYLRNKLLATKDKILAEASPHDLYYGTGTALYQRHCTTETKFKGQNKLGRMLQEIRQSLK